MSFTLLILIRLSVIFTFRSLSSPAFVRLSFTSTLPSLDRNDIAADNAAHPDGKIDRTMLNMFLSKAHFALLSLLHQLALPFTMLKPVTHSLSSCRLRHYHQLHAGQLDIIRFRALSKGNSVTKEGEDEGEEEFLTRPALRASTVRATSCREQGEGKKSRRERAERDVEEMEVSSDEEASDEKRRKKGSNTCVEKGKRECWVESKVFLPSRPRPKPIRSVSSNLREEELHRDAAVRRGMRPEGGREGEKG